MAKSYVPRLALYAGTFDPFTNGHYDICKRALTLFDELVILVAVSHHKGPLLSEDLRLQMIQEVFEGQENISIDSWKGLTVEYAFQEGIQAMIRGLRPTGDFDTEFQMATMNRKLRPDIETVFLVSGEKNSYISSTLVKEIMGHNGDISPFVPPSVLKFLADKKINPK